MFGARRYYDPGIKVTASFEDKGLDAGVNKATKSLAKLSAEANKLDSSLDKSRAVQNRAGEALTNLGRIAQDSAFGFVGIANNINPLQESFSRLRKESGSTGGALKALVGSLSGAGGIGLAFSAVTAAVSFAQIGLSAWTRSVGSSKTATDEAAKATKELSDSYKSIVGDLAKEQAQVSVLVEQLKTENLSRKEKAEAIKQLQSIAPEYFKGLDREKATVDQISAAYRGYVSQLERTFRVRAMEAQYTKVIEKILDLQTKGEQIGQKATSELISSTGKKIKVQNTYFKDGLTGQQALNQTLRGTIALTNEENDELDTLKKTAETILRDLAATKGNDGLTVIDPVKTKKAKETINDVLGELERKLFSIENSGRKLFESAPEIAKKQLSEILSTVNKLSTEFKLAPGNTIIEKLLGSKNNNLFGKTLFEQSLNASQLSKVGEVAVKKIQVGITGTTGVAIPVFPVLNLKSNALDKNLVAFQEVAKAFKNDIESTLNGVFNTIGDSIGKGENPFKAIFQIIGQGIQDLGRALIAYGVQIGIIQKILANPLSPIGPAAAIAAGIALNLIGSVLKSKITNGFAAGGYTGNGDTGAVAGVVHGQEYVLNAAATRRIGVANLNAINAGRTASVSSEGFSGQSFVVNGSLVGRGKDLVAVIDLARASNGRNN